MEADLTSQHGQYTGQHHDDLRARIAQLEMQLSGLEARLAALEGGSLPAGLARPYPVNEEPRGIAT